MRKFKFLVIIVFLTLTACLGKKEAAPLNWASCQNTCLKSGFDSASCRPSDSTKTDLKDRGGCLMPETVSCAQAGQCRCYCYYSLEVNDSGKIAQDETEILLDDLRIQTKILFSLTQNSSFKWKIKNKKAVTEETEITGYRIQAVNIPPVGQLLAEYFIKQGFTAEVLNKSKFAYGNFSAWQKADQVCLIEQGQTGYEQAEANWQPAAGDNLDITVYCGKIPPEPLYVSLAKFLQAPVYNEAVKISGFVQKRQEDCQCFNLIDSDSTIVVRYDNQSVDLGETQLSEREEVILSGQLQPAGSADSQPEFWITKIEKFNK